MTGSKFIEFFEKNARHIMIIGGRIGTPRLGVDLQVVSLLDMKVEADIETLVGLLKVQVLIKIIGVLDLKVNFFLGVMINVTTVVSWQHRLTSCSAARCFTCIRKGHTSINW